MSLTCLFPGQGSQKVGMLGELAARYPQVEDTFAQASAVVGIELWRLAQEGPPEQLNQTRMAQLTLLASEISIWRIYCEHGGMTPAYVAGHSFGEYSALVAAQALEFEAAVCLVSRRGELMQQAAAGTEGGMAAILKMEDERIGEICVQVSQEALVEAVNYNAPGQVVISGLRTGVQKALEICQSEGGRGIPLDVTVPAHSSMMRTVDAEFTQALEETEFRSPQIPVVNNVDVRMESEPARLRDALRRQLHSPVRWREGILSLIAEGVGEFLEMGPGKVLTGLNRRIDRSVQTHCIEDSETLNQVLEEQKNAG